MNDESEIRFPLPPWAVSVIDEVVRVATADGGTWDRNETARRFMLEDLRAYRDRVFMRELLKKEKPMNDKFTDRIRVYRDGTRDQWIFSRGETVQYMGNFPDCLERAARAARSPMTSESWFPPGEPVDPPEPFDESFSKRDYSKKPEATRAPAIIPAPIRIADFATCPTCKGDRLPDGETCPACSGSGIDENRVRETIRIPEPEKGVPFASGPAINMVKVTGRFDFGESAPAVCPDCEPVKTPFDLVPELKPLSADDVVVSVGGFEVKPGPSSCSFEYPEIKKSERIVDAAGVLLTKSPNVYPFERMTADDSFEKFAGDPCPNCDGTGRTDDGDDLGGYDCDTCGGSGKDPGFDTFADQEEIDDETPGDPCPDCGGSGDVADFDGPFDCGTCSGSGRKVKRDNTPDPCPACSGTGRTETRSVCGPCYGSGFDDPPICKQCVYFDNECMFSGDCPDRPVERVKQ